MDKAQQELRRATFTGLAQEYDAIRPSYPAALIDDIIALSQLPQAGHILEIGCGTGQATVLFAQRGYAMTCLDLGAEMIAIAAKKCQSYPRVQFQQTTFEVWHPQRQFDLVISATAFHWIPREIGYPKAASVLTPQGALAIFANVHPTPFTGFFDDVQSVYNEVVPEWRHPNAEPTTAANIKETEAYINSTGLFEPVVVRTYRWNQPYSADDYVRLLNTYSDHHNLEEPKRTRLSEGIREFINRNYGGSISKDYLTILYLARKRQA